MNPLSMPPAEPNGFIHTLNKMGYMTSWVDPTSQAFVDFSPLAPGPVLDIGAAYGVATLAALHTGAQVIANDLEAQHLDILYERVPPHLRANLTLHPGQVPEAVDFLPNSLGAILASRVLHFFDGERIEQTVAKCFEWLAPGGRAFVVADTPYMNNYQHFIAPYEARRRAGSRWPGYIPMLRGLKNGRTAFLPRYFHFLDCEVLERVFGEAGFILERCSLFSRQDYPDDLRCDGREGVGLVARKP
jgi:SAM-dependent methyltransferase